MTDLARLTTIVGVGLAAIHVPCVLIPARARVWIERFPRGRWPAWLLTAADLAWAVYLLFNAPLGRFESVKPSLYVLGPVAFFLVVTFVDELLAPRALGGLFLLIPAPLLAAARWHESGFRYVVIIFAYVLVVEGVILVLSPYQFRKITAVWIRSNAGCRALGVIWLAVGSFLVLMGATVY